MSTPDRTNIATDGSVADRVWRKTNLSWQTVHRVCRALGIDPDAPVANVVVLTKGQHVVEFRVPKRGDRHWVGTERLWLQEFDCADEPVRAVVIRSHGTTDDTDRDGDR